MKGQKQSNAGNIISHCSLSFSIKGQAEKPVITLIDSLVRPMSVANIMPKYSGKTSKYISQIYKFIDFGK